MGTVISVVIPAKDCESVIGACLDSMAAQTRPPQEVIVINDGSSDRTGQVVGGEYPEVRLINLEQSQGFTGACLKGFNEAKGEWVAVLNSDTEAHPDWLREMVAAAEFDPRVGMVASRVLLADPPGTIDSLGLEIKKSGMAFLRDHDQLERHDETRPRLEQVFGPAGSAAMYRRALLEEVGFFEDDFFIYYEDVDLAYRARWRGWKCLLANRARVVHRHSYTMDRARSGKRYLLQRNRLRTIIRNWPVSWLLGYFPFIAAYDLASMALALAKGQPLAAAKARVDVLKALPRDLEKRREIMASRKINPGDMKKWLLNNYFQVDKMGNINNRESSDE